MNEPTPESFLAEESSRYRIAGCKLAEAAGFAIREHDGLHRLALAVADWYATIANEGGRPHE